MDEGKIIEFRLLLAGFLGMFGLATAIILFVLLYQRKLLAQQKKAEAERIQYQQELLESVLAAQESERERIGRDLHDDIGSMLATARLYIQQTQQNSSEKEQAWMRKADEVLNACLQNLRSIARDLVPTILNQLGLIDAIEALCDVLRESGNHQIEFTYSPISQLEPEKALHVYRIVQELLTNTLKHAQASIIRISLSCNPTELQLSYADNGIGLDDHKRSKGLGLKNIESRLSLMRGSINTQPPEAGGTHFLIRIPLISQLS